MRITKLRFRNINSLSGEWTINFEDEGLASDGIFLITGATGAGKTTILDAICLALYGRTPRIDTISKSVNDVMTRQEGECLAEVTFTTAATDGRIGEYRVRWQQWRAHYRADGSLQAPARTFTDLSDGQPTDVTGKAVERKVEETTGMDFEQFTRSMLLAQGAFARFLQSAPDDRAPILEQITKLDSYTKISMAVHDRAGTERRKLDEIAARMGNVTLLSPEELQAIRTQRQEKADEVTKDTALVQSLTGQIHWLDEREGATGEREGARKDKEDAQGQLKAFEETEHASSRLEADTRAAALDADFAALASASGQVKATQESLKEADNALPGLEERASKAGQALEQARTAYEEQRKRLEEERTPLFAEIRVLDGEISVARANLATAQSARKKKEKAIENNGTALKKTGDDLIEAEGKGRELEERRRKAAEAGDSTLPEAFSGIASELKALKERLAAREAAGKAKETADRARDSAVAAIGKAKAACDERQKELDTATTGLGDKQKELAALLGAETIEALRRHRDGLGRLKPCLDRLEAAAGALASLRQEQGKLDEKRAGATSDREAKQAHIDDLQKQHDALKEEILRRELGADMRRTLREGQPCPCCGATHHPWEGKADTDTAKEREELDRMAGSIVQAKTELDALKKTEDGLTRECGRLEGSIESSTQQGAAAMKDLTAARPDLVACLAGTPILHAIEGMPAEGTWPPADEACLAGLAERTKNLQALIEDSLSGLGETIGKATDLESAIRNGHEDVVTKEKARDNAESARKMAELALKAAEENLKYRDRELADQETALARAREQAVRLLVGHGAGLPADMTGAGIDAIVEGLAARLEAWKTLEKDRTDGENLVRKLKAEKDKLDALDTSYRTELDALKKDEEGCGTALEPLLTQRRTKFGEEKVDEVERREKASLDRAMEDRDGKDREKRAADSEVARKQQEKATLSAKLDEERTTEAAAARQLDSGLHERGFSSREEARKARLPEAERRRLEGERTRLAKLRDDADAREKAAQERLDALEKEDPRKTLRSREEIDKDAREAAARIADNQQAIGGIDKQLESDRENREKYSSLKDGYDAQKKIGDRWERLNGLVGSHDGKKFRDFAQNLTLELLLDLANVELARLTDRYRLVMDESILMEFNVVDAYQDGEVRSTKNLSGGESFLVSLALALGLSKLSRGSTRIETLFLDEGFGTLDAEVLDRTMTMLDALSRSESGKLIGIISHVEVLAERIHSKIQVIKGNDGTSRLEGPGCSRTATAGTDNAPRKKKGRKR